VLNIGRIDYINTLPLFLGWDTLPPSFPHRFINSTPSDLNSLIKDAQIEVSTISSAAYLENKETYSLLDNFCIAAEKEVLSVLLFSRYSPKQLDNKNILLSSQSKSSILLLKVLCKRIWNINPQFFEEEDEETEMDAVLLIGNQAMLHKPPQGFLSYDLASLWHQETFMPFVFGVLAAKTNISQNKKDLFCKAVRKSFLWGQKNSKKIIQEAVAKTKLPSAFLQRYFSSLHYKMTDADFRSLDLFESLSNKLLFPEVDLKQKVTL
jgi:predicted solute-binding protein